MGVLLPFVFYPVWLGGSLSTSGWCCHGSLIACEIRLASCLENQARVAIPLRYFFEAPFPLHARDAKCLSQAVCWLAADDATREGFSRRESQVPEAKEPTEALG